MAEVSGFVAMGDGLAVGLVLAGGEEGEGGEEGGRDVGVAVVLSGWLLLEGDLAVEIHGLEGEDAYSGSVMGWWVAT